jgi:hypothetical protein
MTYRITRAHVEAKLDTINRMLGNTDPNGVGTLELSGAYGGWAIHQICNEARGVRDLTGGHGPLREASLFASGMIAALRIVETS